MYKKQFDTLFPENGVLATPGSVEATSNSFPSPCSIFLRYFRFYNYGLVNSNLLDNMRNWCGSVGVNTNENDPVLGFLLRVLEATFYVYASQPGYARYFEALFSEPPSLKRIDLFGQYRSQVLQFTLMSYNEVQNVFQDYKATRVPAVTDDLYRGLSLFARRTHRLQPPVPDLFPLSS